MTITYPKPIMTRTELIKMGVPEVIIDRALHSQWAHEFAEKIGKAKTAKWIINTKIFEKYRQMGLFE